MLRVAPLALAGLLLLTALPAQAAFHGVGWQATGVATNGTLAGTITITWGGFFSNTARNVYYVTITDATGATLVKDDFLGYENLNGPPSCCGSEYLSVTGLRSPIDPGPAFSFAGSQFAFTTSQYMTQVIQGTYGAWSFAAATPYEHYCFC